MQKVWLAMNALPWERLNIQDGPPAPDGTVKKVTAHGDYFNAGFLPVYWDEEFAKKVNPGAKIQEAGVGDEWAKRPAPPSNLQMPQGEQGFNFDVLDKKGMIEKIAEIEADLEARGMKNVVLSLRAFVLGETQPNKAGKDKIQSYLESIHKLLGIRKSQMPDEGAPEKKPAAPKVAAKSRAKPKGDTKKGKGA